MGNSFFKFKQFKINQERCAMKVTTDSCLFGAWSANLLSNEKTILDIGAGTGLLTLMLAQQSHGQFDSVEVESACYEQLIENINSSPWSTQISTYCSDIKLFDAGMKYDLIISNPPFYEQQLKSPNDTTNLARHSEQLSISELFTHAGRLLASNGTLLMLIPYFRKNEVLNIAEKFKFNAVHIADVQQTTIHDSFRSMIHFSREEKNLINETITIKEEAGNYTGRFKDLLRDYYLKF